MKERKPVKRNVSLQPLSREHHQGLLLCWKIRAGFKNLIELQRIKAYVNWFYKNNLLSHFNTEEDFIFPMLGNDNKLVKRALAEHRRLKRLFSEESDLNKSLNLIEEELEKHIRFEERILFPAIEKVATQKELDLIMEIHSEGNSFGDWGDEFWNRTFILQ